MISTRSQLPEGAQGVKDRQQDKYDQRSGVSSSLLDSLHTLPPGDPAPHQWEVTVDAPRDYPFATELSSNAFIIQEHLFETKAISANAEKPSSCSFAV